MRKDVKCAWCGKTVLLSGNGLRPKQHLNGKTTCVGSGQLVETHDRQREAMREAHEIRPESAGRPER
jgi:hypothetical protein